jgi:hypothetical protein
VLTAVLAMTGHTPQGYRIEVGPDVWVVRRNVRRAL